MLKLFAIAAAIACNCIASAQPLSTAFTYQGSLDTSGSPATGTYDFRFALYDAPTGGAQVGATLCSDNVAVSGGKFTAQLDFGSQFAGNQRFLEVQVRQDTGLPCSNTTGFTTLAPRQNLTASPNAIYSLNSATAASATQLNGQPATFYTNAANLSGTLPDARLSTNVATLAGTQTFSGPKTFSSPASFTFGGRTLTITNDSGLVPGLDLTGTSGNIGILRIRNKIEMWPNDAGTTAASIDIRNAAGAPNIALDGAAGNGTFNGQLQGAGLALDPTSANAGTLTNGLVFGNTPGNSGEGLASKRTSGGNQFGLDLFTNFTSRLSITNTGNVGIGTTAPAARLDVNGVIRASGGVIFPDGTTQYRADPSYTTPLVTSGLPNGCTFTCSLSGTAATFAGTFTATVTHSNTTPTVTAPAQKTLHLRRPRTTDQQWANWAFANNNVTVSMVLTAPNGATVTWSCAQAGIVSVSLIQVGATLMEEAEVHFDSNIPLVRTASGTTVVSPPSTNVPSISYLMNSVTVPNSVVVGSVYSNANAIDQNGNPTNQRFGPDLTLRTNPFSTSVLYPAFANLTVTAGAVATSGTTYHASTQALIYRYDLHLADDGLPVEDYWILVGT